MLNPHAESPHRQKTVRRMDDLIALEDELRVCSIRTPGIRTDSMNGLRKGCTASTRFTAQISQISTRQLVT